jgi:hypothetical protein
MCPVYSLAHLAAQYDIGRMPVFSLYLQKWGMVSLTALEILGSS